MSDKRSANSTMLSARSIAHEVAMGTLSAVDAVNLGQRAIEEYEDKIRAFTARPTQLIPGEGPLAGVCIGVKDIFDTADLVTEYGSAIYKDIVPNADAALVSMLRAAGATIAGKTVTTEYAWFQPGPTRNPHNLDHTPGGSSSGSAAGVAAGFFPAAIGTQTGGSMVRPAAFCGVAGYKPSFRLFPTVGSKCFSWSLDTPGFFAASVADAAFVAAQCSGRDIDIDFENTAPPRIGIYSSSIDNLASPDMAAAVQHAGAVASAAGATISTISPSQEIEEAREAHAPIQDYEARLALGYERQIFPQKLSKRLRDHLEKSAAIDAETYDAARRTANKARKACRPLFETCDVIILPSAPGCAPNSLETTGDSIFNRVWTLMGLPAVNIPGLVDKAGMPLGIQMLAAFGQDKKLIQAAHWLEQQVNRSILSTS